MGKQVIENSETLAKILKERRKEVGITQKELADLCDLSHNGISRIEVADNDVKLTTLLKMAKILDIKLVLETED